MDVFPFAPQHEQPVVSDEEASEAAHTLANPKAVASEAGRVLAIHQHQEQEAEKATEEVVLDSGDQIIPDPAPVQAEVVVDEPAAKEPAAKKAPKAKSVRKPK
jgi:hypothetical protein